MDQSPVVSIVVPTRNRRPALERCIDSLLCQTSSAFELIVVDDGSTDDTPVLLNELISQNHGVTVRWFRNEPQIGANPSRNRGTREARGKFVAFVDDDVIAKPDWLERLMEGFVSDRVGAVTGRVESAPARNCYELTLKGTQRVHGRVQASRLVACNMCVRRELIVKYEWDENRAPVCDDVGVSGRGDEEGLYLTLRSAGYEQRVVHGAVVIHDHSHDRRSFFRQAFRGGMATARLAKQYRLPPRIELVTLLLAYVTLPAAWIGDWAWVVPGASAIFFLAAILYNDLFRKGKTVFEVAVTFPLLLCYYHARLAGYAVQWCRMWFRAEKIRPSPTL